MEADPEKHYTLLVTGSREWTDMTTVRRELFEWWWYNRGGGPPTLIHGGARGADKLAAQVAEAAGWNVEEYPADWDRWGKRAGYIRNAEMVNVRPDACLAFILDGSKGATMCAAMASQKKIPTKIVSATTDVGTVRE